MRGRIRRACSSGNLIRDENEYTYEYDYENRLTKVTYDPAGGTAVEVASFTYDALGRMVASTTRFDGESNAMTESLKLQRPVEKLGQRPDQCRLHRLQTNSVRDSVP